MKKRDYYRFGKTSQRRLDTTSEYIAIAATRAIYCSPVDFTIPWMGGKRTAEQQKAIFENGNSQCDGYKKLSRHQKIDKRGRCLAVDIVPYIEGKGASYTAFGRFGVIGMLMLESWEELQDAGIIPRDLYLHWGGFWKSKDPEKLGWDLAHYEISDKPQNTKK